MYNTTAKRHFLAGLFLICMCGLMLQIIENSDFVGHRLLPLGFLRHKHGDVRNDGRLSLCLFPEIGGFQASACWKIWFGFPRHSDLPW